MEREPIETVKYWLNAYSDPASGDHFLGHGMVPVLLREYLAIRESPTPLTSEQIERAESQCWDGPGLGARFDRMKFAKEVIAEFCRVNGIKEPK